MTSTPPDRALLPDFELLREIGRGGMGVVYLALDVKLDRQVAVKVLPDALAGLAEVRARFLREARTAAKLSHPNIVPIHRADEMGGVVFFVMGYVEGESLGERLASRGVLPPLEAARILRDVALALGYAHEHGVVHRDIKPENILIERPTGRALVTDFGIARVMEAAPLTVTGQVLGTVHYMSPEQVTGEPLDGRSDLYSLGVVAFRAVAGRLPFESETASAVLVAHVMKLAPNVRDVAPAVPRAMATVIDACLAKDPNARYQTGAALAAALEEAAQEMARDPQAGVVAPPVVSEREAQAIWARAAQLQDETGPQQQAPARKIIAPALAESGNDRRTLTSGYRLDEVRSAAEEAGISERYVARAAAELGLAPASPGEQPPSVLVSNQTPAPNPWVGSPLSVIYEVQIPGEVSEDEYEFLVDIIRRQTGDPGTVSTLGRTLLWSSSGRRRQFQLSIVPRGGRTTIRADERLGGFATRLFLGLLGGGAGATMAPAFGLGIEALHSVAGGFGVVGVSIGGFYFLARTIMHRHLVRRDHELRAVVEQLAEHVRESVRVKALPAGR